ncbi:MAG: hypothetical protein Q9182_004876 [Xanthomendoza sp. 2 TL-2023]
MAIHIGHHNSTANLASSPHLVQPANNQVPDPAVIFNLKAEQNRSFTNSRRDSVQPTVSTTGHPASKFLAQPSQAECRPSTGPLTGHATPTANLGLGHHFISNLNSSRIIDLLLQTATDTDTPDVDCPGASFEIETDATKALLATPNGLVTASTLGETFSPQAMAASRSLHDKASAVLPDISTKPSNIVVAILKADKNSNASLNEDDFLWIKCHAKTSIAKIHEQYKLKTEEKTPWILQHNGNPLKLESTVGDINEPGKNLVVFQAVNNPPPSQTPALRKPPLHTTIALSPKDPNPRLRPVTIAPKALFISNNENKPHQVHDDPPTITPSPSALAVPTHPLSRSPSYAPHSPFVSPAPPAPYMKVDLGDFPVYRSVSLAHWRTLFRGESDELVGQRLWNNWLGMNESERARYSFSQKPGLVKAEQVASAPVPPKQVSAVTRTNEPLAPATTKDEYGQKHFQLSAMLKDATPQLLESSVEASVKLLNTLRAPLADKMASSPDAEHWIQQIDNLKKLAVKTKTVIGVVGNTGAGKSSVINAMLEEERLVPTNCMRACTAVVTEISYNYEEQPYCAEIEFITAEDWAKELKVLFQDLLDGEGNVSRDCSNEDSDAGVAYAKIKAVYPQKTKDDISRSSIDRMLHEVSHILGTRRNIKETDSLRFYKSLQSYVDSKEKSTGKDKDGKKQKREREFWPLIRVVRLYVKSPALATGAVIVDLPGVHDANAARAAVAEGYMKQCTGLWIVAPINRAVDDKAAKSLLGESFKRQLKMDGGFSAVTFICSKTDDISISEAQDSLGLDDKMVPSWENLDHLSSKQRDLKKEIRELSDTKALYEDAADEVDEQLEVWGTLEESVSDGKVAFAPKSKATKKRKSSSKVSSKQKKRKVSSDDEDDADFIDDGSEEDEDALNSDEEATGDDAPDQQPLTQEQVAAKLEELKATKKDARLQKREITEKMQELRNELKEVENAVAKINSEMSALCISGRNQYSKGAIQQDFAAGIKEIDQEIAAEEDEDNFNPDNEVRDYDEVAKSLPVFCVSSRGYQKLQGRLRKEPPVPGFRTVEETEIPALQAHCEKLTETGRAANCRAFINRLSSLLNSLTIWASSDGTGANLTAEQKAKEARYLQKGLEGLETRLENVTKSCAQALNDEFSDAIYDRYEAAVQAAYFDSVPLAEHWGAPVNRENRAAGGLFWASYKAVCRRNGCFTNGQGLHDWNAQLSQHPSMNPLVQTMLTPRFTLAEPLIKLIAPGWEKVFTRRVQSVMTNLTKTVPAVLKKFHRDIEDRARKIGTGLASLSMLSHQITVYEQVLKDAAASTKDVIITRQKDINREFTPVIERAMIPSYEWCEAERGPGQYKRMKVYMKDYVETNRHTMFQESAQEVKRQLQAMVKDIEETLADKMDEVFIQIKRDYRAVLGAGDVPEGEVLPRVQRLVRKDIKRTIDGVERMMRIIVGLEVEDLADAVEPVDEISKSDSSADDDEDDQAMNGKAADLPASADIKREAGADASSKLQRSDSTISDTNEVSVPTKPNHGHSDMTGSLASGEQSSVSEEMPDIKVADEDMHGGEKVKSEDSQDGDGYSDDISSDNMDEKVDE